MSENDAEQYNDELPVKYDKSKGGDKFYGRNKNKGRMASPIRDWEMHRVLALMLTGVTTEKAVSTQLNLKYHRVQAIMRDPEFNALYISKRDQIWGRAR